MVVVAENHPPLISLRSSATVGGVLSPPLPLQAEIARTNEGVLHSQPEVATLDRNENNNRELSFYDLYQSPCRGILRASNDELLDFVDLDNMNDDSERKYIISFNSGSSTTKQDNDLYRTYYYYYDDMEYCGATFLGGCSYYDLDELEDQISNSTPSVHDSPSFVNWTVAYDYEVHYIDKRVWTGVEDEIDDVVDDKIDGDEPLLRDRVSNDMGKQLWRGDPIPAVEYLETIVLEHIGEVVGLSRRGCDASEIAGRTAKLKKYLHDFTDEELERMMAISSYPGDVLDPDHANCTVPVSWTIGQTTDCVPVTGGIRIYLNITDMFDGVNKEEEEASLENLKLSIESGFQRLIRFGMQQDLYVSAGGDGEEEEEEEVLVKHVSFIGTRVFVPDSEYGDASQVVSAFPNNLAIPSTNIRPSSPANEGQQHDTFNGYDGYETPSFNQESNGDYDTTREGNRIGIVLASITLAVLAFLGAMWCSNCRWCRRRDRHVPLVADNWADAPPTDAEQPFSSNVEDGVVPVTTIAPDANNDIVKAADSGRSILSDTTIEDMIYEDFGEEDQESAGDNIDDDIDDNDIDSSQAELVLNTPEMN